ncbi:hypothetical protein CXG81DRAFT_20289 [Caulochytrium protostelioides]|uniref:GAF domain-containing protein n=2 Tax=Caulochytrium protostelioides TaxID=1555241 RepID=A0A4P9X3P9_9FUNG|nr:hypothetical protein CXG81DRAFT_20289 [Caulochytrium protostelioides]|eukprot:RKO99665.1 hypothetical protein CXG81DRAFT_20289 [Caulochytrium protostelioides]
MKPGSWGGPTRLGSAPRVNPSTPIPAIPSATSLSPKRATVGLFEPPMLPSSQGNARTSTKLGPSRQDDAPPTAEGRGRPGVHDARTLRLHLAPPVSPFEESVAAAAPAAPVVAPASNAADSFVQIQNMLAAYALLTDSERAQLLKGLVVRSSSKQLDLLKTHVMGRTVGPPAVPETPAGLALATTYTKLQHRGGPADVGRMEAAGEAAAKLPFNTSMYLRLINPGGEYHQAAPTQALPPSTSPSEVMNHFLTERCNKLHVLLRSLASASKDPSRSASVLLQAMLDMTQAKWGTIYVYDEMTDNWIVLDSNWQEEKASFPSNRLFGSNAVRSNHVANTFNIHLMSESWPLELDMVYEMTEPRMLLAVPVWDEDTARVVGMLEVINKADDVSAPRFDAEDELLIGLVARLWRTLVGSSDAFIAETSNEVSGASKSNGANIQMLLGTANLMSSDMDTGGMLTAVMQTAKELLQAERSTLFLLDREQQQLWSTVAGGSVQIRIPMTAGIAGHVAQTGTTLNIPDAYNDKRFDRSVDARTGFRTRTILCMALRDASGQIMGVCQVINKLPEGTRFKKEDESLLGAFTALAAAAIERSLLYSALQEELAQTTWNAATNQLMADAAGSVVLVLDQRGCLVKATGADRLGLDETALGRLSMIPYSQWLGDNPLLITDLATSLADGQSIFRPNAVLTIRGQAHHVHYRTICVAVRSKPGSTGKVASAAAAAVATSPPNRSEEPSESGTALATTSGLLLVLDDITPVKQARGLLTRYLQPHHPQGNWPRLLPAAGVLVASLPRDMLTDAHDRSLLTDLNAQWNPFFDHVRAYEGVLTAYDGGVARIVFGMLPERQGIVDAVQAAYMYQQSQEGALITYGVASSAVMAGFLGQEHMRMDLHIFGEAVPVAEYLSQINRLYRSSILVDAATSTALKDQFHFREIDIIQIHGTDTQVVLHEVVGLAGMKLSHERQTSLMCFELGLSEYRSQNWGAAIANFKQAVQLTQDPVSYYFIDRCRALIEGRFPEATDDTWDGVWRALDLPTREAQHLADPVSVLTPAEGLTAAS